jgi:N-methylhydantoinase A
MARSLGIKRVMVPPAPGLFSAVGLLMAQPEQHFVQTFFGRADFVDLEALNRAYAGMEARGARTLTDEGYRTSDITWRRAADLRYVGQAYELSVAAPSHALDSHDVDALVDGFHREHERTYGHKAEEEAVEIVNLRMTALGRPSQSVPVEAQLQPSEADGGRRSVFFGPDRGVLPTPIVARSDISSAARGGPLIIEEYDATVVVPPGCEVSLDRWGNIVIDVGESDA